MCLKLLEGSEDAFVTSPQLVHKWSQPDLYRSHFCFQRPLGLLFTMNSLDYIPSSSPRSSPSTSACLSNSLHILPLLCTRYCVTDNTQCGSGRQHSARLYSIENFLSNYSAFQVACPFSEHSNLGFNNERPAQTEVM